MTEQALLHEIFKEYNPLQKIDHALFQKQKNNEFETFVRNKLKDLPEKIKERIVDEVFGWGPISSLLEMDDLYDIIIQGSENIFYETSKGIQKHNDQFLSALSFQNFIEKISHECALIVDKKTPFANGKFKKFRIHIAIPPISHCPTITLRKHNTQNLTLTTLGNQNFLNYNQKKWLEKILNEKKNFLVVGPTGSGKTTFINTILSELAYTERVVIVEDTDELKVPNTFSAKLLSRETCPATLDRITIENLVKQSLRMRPDRIVVGEVRGQEAKDLLQALATGHSGSMGTLHAHTAKQALIRLEMLIQMGAPQWSLYSIRQLIRMSLDYLIVLKEDRLNKGIAQICQIGALEDFGLLLEDLDL